MIAATVAVVHDCSTGSYFAIDAMVMTDDWRSCTTTLFLLLKYSSIVILLLLLICVISYNAIVCMEIERESNLTVSCEFDFFVHPPSNSSIVAIVNRLSPKTQVFLFFKIRIKQ
jgi:hypothetical protein